MQIVIDIPEDIKAVIDKNGTNEIVAETVWQAIKKGTPLPKGHGRLIDADAYREAWFNSRQFEPMLLLDFAPTIIEADKEVEE
jgi:hypothetical protein